MICNCVFKSIRARSMASCNWVFLLFCNWYSSWSCSNEFKMNSLFNFNIGSPIWIWSPALWKILSILDCNGLMMTCSNSGATTPDAVIVPSIAPISATAVRILVPSILGLISALNKTKTKMQAAAITIYLTKDFIFLFFIKSAEISLSIIFYSFR